MFDIFDMLKKDKDEKKAAVKQVTRETIIGDIRHKHVLPGSQPHFGQVIRRDHKASVIANGIRAFGNFNEYPSSYDCIDI